MSFRKTLSLALLCLACHGLVWTSRAAAPAGITEPVFDVILSLPVPGIVARLPVREGDFVSTNQVILELDNRLEELEVDRRKHVLDNRKADLESTRMVFEKSTSVSRDELLKKEADYKIALTEYATAVEQLARRKLLSPGAGVIAELRLEVGESCSAYEPVVRVVDSRACYFVCNVEAEVAARLAPGQTTGLEIDTGKGPARVDGRVVFVSPVVDSSSGLQRVKVWFDNLDQKIRPGVAGRLLLNPN
jgi:membrane fusion protein (multidrug efflux system)